MEHPNVAASDAHLDRLLMATDIEEPWYKSIVRNVREVFHPPVLPPLEITSKPLEGADLGGMETVEKSWFKSFATNIKELIHPPKLPPLEVTSKPVEVGSIWGAYAGGESKSGMMSLTIHVGVIVLLLIIFRPMVFKPANQNTTMIYSPIGQYKPKVPAKMAAGGGGGGGNHAPKPVSRGEAPKMAPRQFIPPTQVNIPKPTMPTPPTITAEAPTIKADNYGDPMANSQLISPGQGALGLGNGKNSGLGNGDGNGFGNGSGGGTGGGAYRIGGDVSAPQILSKVEPEYSEEARKAKFSGAVLLSIVVDENGLPRNIKVIRALGLGLDEKAIEAVSHWRFRPGHKNGQPVATQAQVEVNFRLL